MKIKLFLLIILCFFICLIVFLKSNFGTYKIDTPKNGSTITTNHNKIAESSVIIEKIQINTPNNNNLNFLISSISLLIAFLALIIPTYLSYLSNRPYFWIPDDYGVLVGDILQRYPQTFEKKQRGIPIKIFSEEADDKTHYTFSFGEEVFNNALSELKVGDSLRRAAKIKYQPLNLSQYYKSFFTYVYEAEWKYNTEISSWQLEKINTT